MALQARDFFRFSGYFLGLILLAQLALILWLRPWYGIADDAHLLQICDQIQTEGNISAFLHFMKGDIGWGMFRPTFFLMTEVMYCPTQSDPTILYFINALFVFGVLFYSGSVLFRILPLQKWPKHQFLIAYMLVSLCYYRFYDHLYIVGMQEKLMLLAGTISLHFFARRERGGFGVGSNSIAKDILAISFCLALGFSTKAQFLLYLPALFLLLFINGLTRNFTGSHLVKLAFFLMVALAGMVIIKHISAHGGYTSRYSFSLPNLVSNLKTRSALVLIFVASFSLLWELRVHGRKFQLVEIAQALIPASFIFSFLAIMAPWSIGDSYIIAPMAGFVAFCLVSAWQSFNIESTKYFLAPIIALAIALSLFRSYRGIGRYSDFRNVIFSPQLKEIYSKPHLVYMGCQEGSGLTPIYVERYLHAVLNTTNEPLDVAEKAGVPIYAIADSALCKLDPTIVNKFKIISQPRFQDSFAIYEWTGNKPN